MTTFYRYRTTTNTRWDTIASAFRKNPYDYVDIIQANPNYQGYHLLPEGVIISVPVKEETTTRLLRPWEKNIP